MPNLYDMAYWTGVGISSPVWAMRAKSRKKVLSALNQRMGRVKMRPGNNPAVLIHAVSLGEVNATQSLVRMLQTGRRDLQLILSTTTETGYAQAIRLFPHDSGVTVIRFPLDFSSAVRQVLVQLRPTVVVLMELELWPNFMKLCAERSVPVVLVNGRLTRPSYRKYRLGGSLVKRMFSRLSATCVQDEVYAERFGKLGAPNVSVTGTMKFDTAQLTDRVSGTAELAREVGLSPQEERIWVAGSTGPGEEEIILREYRQLLAKGAHNLRLVLVPRHPDRFDAVEELIRQHKLLPIRRSAPRGLGLDHAIPPVVLGDTLGELKKFYDLADVVFVGRSLVDLGSKQNGSDMIEAAALGKAVIVGPFTQNFAEAMKKFREAAAIIEVRDGAELSAQVVSILQDPKRSAELGQKARQVVEREQGATARHARVILQYLPPALVEPEFSPDI